MVEEVVKSALFDLLTCLETRLATPVIPGEEAAWLKGVGEAFANLGSELRQAVATTHLQQFRDMRVEDAVMGPTIDSLKQGDEANVAQWELLNGRLTKLKSKFRSEANETLLSEDLDVFVNEGLSLVVSVRKQETVVQTWYSEAFRRDTGAMD